MQDETHLTVYVSVTIPVGLAFDGTGPLDFARVRAAAIQNFLTHPALDEQYPDLDGYCELDGFVDRLVIEAS